MAAESFDMTSFYAKRIIGDSGASDPLSALMRSGEGVTANTWLFYRDSLNNVSNNNKYGILFSTDENQIINNLELYGQDTSKVKVNLDTGNTEVKGTLDIAGVTTIADTTGITITTTTANNVTTNSYSAALYVNGSAYLGKTTYINGHIHLIGPVKSDDSDETNAAQSRGIFIRNSDFTSDEARYAGFVRWYRDKDTAIRRMQLGVYDNRYGGTNASYFTFSMSVKPKTSSSPNTDTGYIQWTGHYVGHEILPYYDGNSSYNLGSVSLTNTSDPEQNTYHRWYNIYLSGTLTSIHKTINLTASDNGLSSNNSWYITRKTGRNQTLFAIGSYVNKNGNTSAELYTYNRNSSDEIEYSGLIITKTKGTSAGGGSNATASTVSSTLDGQLTVGTAKCNGRLTVRVYGSPTEDPGAILRVYNQEITTASGSQVTRTADETILWAYNDHRTSGTTANLNVVLKAHSNLILHAGEQGTNLYTAVAAGSTSENLYLTADGIVHIAANCNDNITDRVGFRVSTDHYVQPTVGGSVSTEVGYIGTSGARWAAFYGKALNLSGNATISGSVSAGAISGSSLTVTGAVSGATGTFSGAVSTGALTSTSGKFTSNVYINKNTDVTRTNKSGSLVIGSKDGENLGLDANEIMARDGDESSGWTTGLNLNTDNSTDADHLANVIIGGSNDSDAHCYIRYKKAATSTTSGALRVAGGIACGTTVRAKNFYAEQAGTTQITCSSTDFVSGSSRLQVHLEVASSGNHGVYSNGYTSGTAGNFKSSTKWLIYRDTSGNIICNGSAASLTTTHTIWGQDFNGTDDVTGVLTNNRTSAGVFIQLKSNGTNCGCLRLNAVGTTSATGQVDLLLGNNSTSTTSNNATGRIYMGNGTSTWQSLIAKNGTLAGSTRHYIAASHWFSAAGVVNAVWNDYAECRNVDTDDRGYCVTETTSGQMIKTTKRLQAGCKITSDTFGSCMGETLEAKTPIAVSGRVLVYPYRAREEYELGAAVCSAPGGTVDIMTRDEIMMYPERIVGTVSEIPNYEIWHGGLQDGNNDIEVNGRIWIYVR